MLSDEEKNERARLLITALHDRLFNMSGGEIPKKWLNQIERTFWPKRKRGRPPSPAAEIWKLDVANECVNAWFDAKGKPRGFQTEQFEAIADKYSKKGHALTLKKVEGIFCDYATKALSRELVRRFKARD